MPRRLSELAVVRTVTWAHFVMSELHLSQEQVQLWYQRSYVSDWGPAKRIPGTFRGYASGRHDPSAETRTGSTPSLFEACNREVPQGIEVFWHPLFNILGILDPLYWRTGKTQKVLLENGESLCLDEALRSEKFPDFLLGQQPPKRSDLPIRPAFKNFDECPPKLPNPISEIYYEMLRVPDANVKFEFFDWFSESEINRRYRSIEVERELLLQLSDVDRLTIAAGLVAEAYFSCNLVRLKKAKELVCEFLPALSVKLFPPSIRTQLREQLHSACLSLNPPVHRLKGPVSPKTDLLRSSELRGFAWIAAREVQSGRIGQEEMLKGWELLNPEVKLLRTKWFHKKG